MLLNRPPGTPLPVGGAGGASGGGRGLHHGADGGHGAVLHPREEGDHHAQGHDPGQADQGRLQPLVMDSRKKSGRTTGK